MRLLLKPAIGGATGAVGRSGAADPHGHSECSGVNSSRPALRGDRGELNSPAAAVQAQTAKPRGLSPGYFTELR